MKSTFEIKKTDGTIIFEYEAENNSVKKTLEEYIKKEKASIGIREMVNLHNIDLFNANLRGIDLSNTDLKGSNLTAVNLEDAILINADLRKTNLIHSKLNNADLSGAKLKCANLSEANLTNVNLSKADLSDADLLYTILNGANLSKANLERANLQNANLKDSKISGANFRVANLNSVKNLQYASCYFTRHGNEGKQLLAVKIDNEIILFCGYFKGNEAKFRERIEKGKKKYKTSRLIALETILKLIEL